MPRYNKNVKREFVEDGSRSFKAEHSGMQQINSHRHNNSDIFGLGGKYCHTYNDEGDDLNDAEARDYFTRPKSKGIGSYGNFTSRNKKDCSTNFNADDDDRRNH
jgi:hypothetical protein